MTLLVADNLIAELESGHGPVRVLDGVSLQVASGEFVDVVGPSGSGKTTFLLALARLLPGARGSLTLAGRPASDFSPQQWRANVGLLPQTPALVPGDVRQNLLLPWSLKVRSGEAPPSDSVLTEALASVGLDGLALDRDGERLSVGQQGRIALLRVLLGEPRVLLLDEPDAALDEESAGLVSAAAAAFAEKDGAVVRVRHRPPDGVARRRLRLTAGRLEEVPL